MNKVAVVYWSGTGNTQAMAEAVASAAGAEQFEPMFEDCKSHLNGKKVALFGSYGWGDGEWMRNWEAECLSLGANMVCECVICQETPDDEALAACEALGRALAEG